MENKCSICGGVMKTIPAGISKKTGNPYNEFTACEKGCRKPSATDEKFEKLLEALRGIYGVLDEIKQNTSQPKDKEGEPEIQEEYLKEGEPEIPIHDEQL